MTRIAKLITVVALALLAAFAATQGLVPSANAAFTDTDADGALDIAEEVFGSNPNSAASTPEAGDAIVFLALPDALLSCSDGLDNDGDGASDIKDQGCLDTDGDSLSDQTEVALGSDPANDEGFPEDSRLTALFANSNYSFIFSSYCFDEEDNDVDGLVDAADPGCAPLDADSDGFEDFVEKSLGADWEDADSQPEHVTVNPDSCDDGSDNDGDGASDGADDGCVVAPNDNLADAIDIDSLPFTHTAKAANATAEFGERTSECTLFEDTEELRGTLWYKITAPAGTPLLVDATGSDILTSISVWHDGTFGLQEVDCVTSFFYFGIRPRLAFEATEGETYYVQVERLLSLSGLPDLSALDLGRLSFHMEATEPPPNDDFAGAAPITGLPFTASADTIAASLQAFEPESTCQDSYSANSVWYRYTPAVDTYIYASAFPGTDFGATIGVYEGTSLAALEQVACGGEALAFHARAGQTYYFQAAGYTCQSPSEGGEAASFCLDSRSGQLELHVESFELPSCPAPQFTYVDPSDDAKPHDGPPAEITSTSIAFDDYSCVTVNLRGADIENIEAELDIDQDVSRDTGWGGWENECGPPGIGLDDQIRWDGPSAGMLPTGSSSFLEPSYVVTSASSVTFMLPAPVLEDGHFAYRVTAWARGSQDMGSHYLTDCAPNGGHIACSGGTCAFVPFRNGDANCVTGANAIDAAIILQHSAGLLSTLPCPTAADVDGNEVIDSRDAALILQFSAGLLDQLPPIPCFKPPEFC